MSGFVYVLELQDQKFYVGWSLDVQRRIAQHFLGRGSCWTRLHPPLDPISVEEGSKELENCKTIALMIKKGWRNVRGGNWTRVLMTTPPPPLLKALECRPPDPLPGTIEVLNDHCVHLIRTDEETYLARISGKKQLLNAQNWGT